MMVTTPIWAFLLIGATAVSGVGLVLSSLRGGGPRPCQKCGREMEPTWAQCLFCGASATGASNKTGMLHFVTGPLKDKVVYLEKQVTTIGSVPGNDVILQETGVSRKHVGIRKVEGGYELADFGSTNGVYVNGERMPRKRLSIGDIIRVGSSEIIFRT